MRKISLYLRVSTEEAAKAQEGSLISQQQRLEEYVKTRNQLYPNWGKIVGVYVEEGRSAKDTNRPKYQEMLRDVERKKADTILVTELSRLSRSMKDFCDLCDFLRIHGAQFLSLREQFDTTTAAGEMMMFSIMNFAQFERKQTAERVSANFRARALRGLFNGGLPPLGFNVAPNKKGTLLINKKEAAQVRRLFEIFHEKGSIPATLVELKGEGITTKRHIRKDGEAIGGKDYCLKSLWHALRNRHYIGEREINKKSRYNKDESLPKNKEYQTAKASWPGIVSPELFEAVQEQLRTNYRRYKPENWKTFEYTWTSKIHCVKCGKLLVGRSGNGRKGEKYVYYSHKAGANCDFQRYDAKELHIYLRRRLKRLGEWPGFVDQLYREMKDQNSIAEPCDKDRIGEIATEIKSLGEEVSNLVDKLEKLPSGISSDALLERLRLKEARFKVLTNEKQRLESAVNDPESMTIEANALFEFAKRMDKNFSKLTPAERKQIVRLFFGKIEISPTELYIRYNCSKELVTAASQVLDLAIGSDARGADPDGPAARPSFAKRLSRASGLLTMVDGGKAGIRTLDTAFQPYNGLANRRLQPLGHLSSDDI
jgi:site-specific DNA recombinase